MYRTSLSIRAGLVGLIACTLTLGAIVSLGLYADEATPAQCKDRAVALSVSNTCPEGMYLELRSFQNEERYVVCHCRQPATPIKKPSSQAQDDGDADLHNPEMVPAPMSVEL